MEFSKRRLVMGDKLNIALLGVLLAVVIVVFCAVFDFDGDVMVRGKMAWNDWEDLRGVVIVTIPQAYIEVNGNYTFIQAGRTWEIREGEVFDVPREYLKEPDFAPWIPAATDSVDWELK